MKTYKNTLLLLVFALIFWGCDLGSGSDGNKEQPKVPTTPTGPTTPTDPTTPVTPPVPVKTYTITFHSNNGLDETGTQVVEENKEFILTGNTFTKQDHGFTGWSLIKDSGVIDYVDLGLITPITSDLDLYANWANGDTQAPVATNVVIDTLNIDTTHEGKTVTIKVWGSDDYHLEYAEIVITDGINVKTQKIQTYNTEFSGSNTSGIFTLSFSFGKGAPNNTWSVERLTLQDMAGKTQIITDFAARGWDSSFNVESRPDLLPPEIINVTLISDPIIDTSTGDKEITFVVDVKDDISIEAIEYYLSSPVSGQGKGATLFYGSSNYSGEIDQGRFTITVPITDADPAGEWYLGGLLLTDNNERAIDFNTQDLIDRNLNFIVTKAGIVDTADPVIKNVTITPSAVDTTDGNKTVTISVDVEDDMAIGSISVSIIDPLGKSNCNGSYYHIQRPATSPEYTGNEKSGTFTLTFTVPEFYPNGVWKISNIWVFDHLDKNSLIYTSTMNRNGWDTTFTKSGQEDLEHPEIVSFTMNTGNIDISAGPALATFTMKVTDDIKVDKVSVILNGPYHPAYLDLSSTRELDTTSSQYNAATGTFTLLLTIPSVGAGHWYVENIKVTDAYGKTTEYGISAIPALNITALSDKGWDYSFNAVK